MSGALSGATIDVGRPAPSEGGRPRRNRRATPRNTLTPGAGLGLGIAMLWFSLLVLVPLSAIIATAAAGGWENYINTLQDPQTWNALKLTVSQSLIVTLINVVMGTVIAWVLVRDRFVGKTVLNVIIDIPFALPTVVAGLVLLALYGPSSLNAPQVAEMRMRQFLMDEGYTFTMGTLGARPGIRL